MLTSQHYSASLFEAYIAAAYLDARHRSPQALLDFEKFMLELFDAKKWDVGKSPIINQSAAKDAWRVAGFSLVQSLGLGPVYVIEGDTLGDDGAEKVERSSPVRAMLQRLLPTSFRLSGSTNTKSRSSSLGWHQYANSHPPPYRETTPSSSSWSPSDTTSVLDQPLTNEHLSANDISFTANPDPCNPSSPPNPTKSSKSANASDPDLLKVQKPTNPAKNTPNPNKNAPPPPLKIAPKQASSKRDDEDLHPAVTRAHRKAHRKAIRAARLLRKQLKELEVPPLVPIASGETKQEVPKEAIKENVAEVSASRSLSCSR
jgi:hypothetical protein